MGITTTYKVSFWNLHGFSNLEHSSLISGSDIIAACETWLTHSYTPGYLRNFDTYWSEALREHAVGRASGGLMTAINKKHESSLIVFSPWWIFNEIKLGSSIIILGSVYLRKCLDLKYLLDLLQGAIDDIKETRHFDVFIIGGDMNARVGMLNPWPTDLFTGYQLYDIFRSTDDFTCERGRRVMEFMVENNFVLINGRSISDSPAQPTFDSSGSSIIDLVWIDISSLHVVNDLEVILEPSLSDHHPVCLSISLEDYSQPVTNENAKIARLSKIKWSDNAADQYLVQLSNFFISQDISSLSTDNIQTLLHDHMFSAAVNAKLVVNFGPSSKNRTPRNPWFDSCCKLARSELRKALKNLKSDRNNSNLRNEVSICKNKYREVCKMKKKAHIDSIKLAFANVKAPADFWAAVRKFNYKHSTYDIPIDCWNNFYSTIFKDRVLTSITLLSPSNDILDAEITFSELNSVLNSLKPGKAAGPDLLINELYKTLSSQHKELLCVLFNRVLDEEQVPKCWARIWMTMLHKKGDKSDPSNYRGIALVNIVTKIFTTILKNRLVQWTDINNVLPDSQMGFRKGRSCTDAIFTLLSAIQIQFRHNDGREIYGIFVDFQRAFDSVPHTRLWQKLDNLKISSKFIKTIKSLYDQASMQVRTKEGLSDIFEITEGVLQGESLSPDLFLLYLHDFELFFRSKGLYGLDINGVTDILMLLYADDTVIFAHSHIDLQRKLRALEEYCDLNQLTVNKSKTKILIFKAAGRIRDCPCHFRTYKQTCLELVKSYTYLGVEVSTSTKGLSALNSAINKAKSAAGVSLSILSKAKCDSWNAFIKIFDSMVSSVFLYAFPAWGLWYRNSLEPAQTYFFKKLFKLPKCTPDWAVRLEFGLEHVAFKAMKTVWSWLTKTLRANSNCLHKICLLRLFSLATNSTITSPFNWASQLRAFLTDCDALELLNSVDHVLLESKYESLFNRYKSNLHSQDLTAARNSRSLIFSLQLPDPYTPASHLLMKLPLNSKRLVTQLRLSNKFNCYLIANNSMTRFSPSMTCLLCNSKASDTTEHLLTDCPYFTSFRAQYLQNSILSNEQISSLLSSNDTRTLHSIINYITKSLQLRAWALHL